MSLPELVTLDSVVTRAESLASAAGGAEIVMRRLENTASGDTATIGGDIWGRLAAPVRVRELCAAVADACGVDSAMCERDVLAFLNDALREGMILIQADPA